MRGLVVLAFLVGTILAIDASLSTSRCKGERV
jgi:hypothetical protein